MLRIPLIALLLASAILIAPWPAAAIQVEAIPSPRPDGWSVDLTGTLPPETLREIDRLGDQIKAANGAEIVVVLVDTTEGVPSRDFATRLFNHWGIGEREVDNGLLIFAALSDRRAEIVLGRGLDDSASQTASAEIMQGEIIPRFKSGDPGGALLAGTRACAWRILNVPLTEAQPVAAAAPPASLQGDDDSDLLARGALLVAAFAALFYVIWQSRQLASGTSESSGRRSSSRSSDTVPDDLRRHSRLQSLTKSTGSSSSSSGGSGFGGGQSSGGGSSGSW